MRNTARREPPRHRQGAPGAASTGPRAPGRTDPTGQRWSIAWPGIRAVGWPLSVLLTWGLAWSAWLLLRMSGGGHAWALVGALVVAGLGAALHRRRWRRLISLLGFPLSALVLVPAAAVPGWVWLLPLLLLWGLYPLRAWREAPWFPTPRDALRGLDRTARLGGGGQAPRILDAGCGHGAGLRALRAAYPSAQLVGIEWSPGLRWLCAWRCRWASVRRGDIWAEPWAAYDMVYLFQRPESMPRAAAKADRELRPGSWLVSLEFPADALLPAATLQAGTRRQVWLYRAPFTWQAGRPQVGDAGPQLSGPGERPPPHTSSAARPAGPRPPGRPARHRP